uniref:Ig-like domain-containing protein n=1 Tax=Takifugu rubripes TaxID=31033 RepID=A0A674PCH7_TAKRU
MHTLGPLHSSGSATQQLISSLTFIPEISIHKGAVFKCQVSYVGKDKIVVERVSEKFTILCKKYQLLIYWVFFIQILPFKSEKGYDKSGIFRKHTEKKDQDCFYCVCLTLGFIKRPCVSEIMSFTSSPDQTLNLGCEITDFYPANVKVIWLKLRGGDRDDAEEEEEVLDGGEIWGPVQTHPRLYRATRGGGVICRVEHCSLLEPIQRRWKNVEIASFIRLSLYRNKRCRGRPKR